MTSRLNYYNMKQTETYANCCETQPCKANMQNMNRNLGMCFLGDLIAELHKKKLIIDDFRAQQCTQNVITGHKAAETFRFSDR